MVDITTPFALAYIDWAKEVMGAKTLQDTERHDWVMKFGKIYSDAGGSVTGIDIALAKGVK